MSSPSAFPPPELLLFDLGGVLVDFSGARDLVRFMRRPLTPSEILTRWISCPHTSAYEAGRLPVDDWAERLIRDWELNVTPDEFVSTFATWSRGFFAGATDLLAELRQSYRLAALSNSNALHWKSNEQLGILREFEFALGSHELGCCKPQPEIFKLALERAKVSSPAAVVFFDDIEANVAGARSVGLRAFQVQGVDGLRQRLASEGLLRESKGPRAAGRATAES